MGGLKASLFFYILRINKDRQKMTEDETIEMMLMEMIAEECTVSTDEVMEYPPTAISLGEKTIQGKDGDITIPIPIGTYGNFSFVQAPPKTKKTFFISLLASVFLSGKNNFGGKIKGHRDGKCLMHFDTEQGHWHAQRVFRRVEDMAGTKELGCYITYALRTINYKQRMQFIEYTLEKNKGNNGLVIIDGIADLVSDVNNLEESNLCVQKIMQLSAKYNCHIVTVIHSNFGSDKPTGHLGSFLYKKHKTWMNIVKSFGCPENITEDIVQEMYIYLIKYEREGKDLWYGNQVNYYYVFKQLRGIYVQYLRSASKIKKVSLDEIQEQFQEIDPLEYEEQYEKFINSYLKVADDLHWYDKKVFEFIAKGTSVAELSRNTKIGYYSLYNTYNTVKDKLKNDLL
jgi:hypothetical protein